MLFVATLLGLALQAFTATGFPWRSAVFWGHYLCVFQGRAWFVRQSASIQAILLFLPIMLVVVIGELFFAKPLWGLGILAFYLLCFALCCDGYRYIDILGHFANPERAAPQALYEAYFGMSGAPSVLEHEPCLRSAILTESLLHLILYLFTPLFWFVWLGPLAGLVIALALAIVPRADSFTDLSQRLSHILHWAVWLPARLFSLALFFIQRVPHATVREWWSLVRSPKQDVSALVRVTIKLSMLDARISAAGAEEGRAWDGVMFADAKRLCHRAVLFWLGAFAVCALLF